MIVPELFAARLERLRSAMREVGADLFLCDHAEMLHWLTGYTVSETFYRGCVVPLEGDPVWVLRAIDEVPCRAATWVTDVEVYADHEDSHAAVARVIQRFDPKVIGADFSSFGFTVHTMQRLQSLLPGVQFTDLPRISNLLRARKDPSEIAKIAMAAGIADGAMAAIARDITPGMRSRDASAIGAQFYLKSGADDYWVGPISIARRSAGAAGGHGMGFLHATFTEDRLAEGDILHVELVPRVSFYSARFMRSICIGTPSEDDQQTMAEMVALQDAQIAAMAPGAVARDVDAIMREGALTAGLRDTYPNITGYLLGIYAKTPRSSDTTLSLHPGADWRFEAGQVFHIYTTAKGLALSETVLVTENGSKVLTRTPRRILSAGEDLINEAEPLPLRESV